MRVFSAILSMAFLWLPSLAFSQENDAKLIERGRYIAIAGDCGACHGANLAGGAPIVSPIGDIYASNITFDAKTGIGNWTEKQFADALRKGRAPDKGWLYPAMPYTSYTAMTDEDVKALYTYLKSQPGVVNKVEETQLGFPFVRPMMVVWNALNLHEGTAPGTITVDGKEAARGQYLVETLEHCSVCHTPRGALMQELNDQHLAGAFVGGWYAPNITSGKTGIGQWSDEQLKMFFKTGHNDIAVAGGDMGLAVERSLTHLTDSDIHDIIAYLRQVPAVPTSVTAGRIETIKPINPDTVEHVVDNWQSQLNIENASGASLYNGACASCHGFSGTGGAGVNLTKNSSVHSPEPNNVVQVIANGIHRNIDKKQFFMPAFSGQLDNQEIASITNYVRVNFGGIEKANISAKQVGDIVAGKTSVSWLIRYASLLAWSGVVAAIIIFILLVLFFRRRKKAKA